MAKICNFSSDWLDKKDRNGNLINTWAKKDGKNTLFCGLCLTSFSTNGGFDSIQKHAKGKKHSKLASISLNHQQLRLSGKLPQQQPEEQGSSSTIVATEVVKSPVNVALSSTRDTTAMAECRWVMHCIDKNFSAASCENLQELFKKMFGEEAVNSFSISRTKFRYLLSHGLGPYFYEKLLDDLGSSLFSLSFDETTNSAGAKELQFVVTYWSETKKEVSSHHLQTYFIGEATSEVLLEKTLQVLEESKLSLNKMLMLGMDGPNVNLKLERLLSKKVEEVRGSTLLKIGSCNLHIIHNAYEKGLQCLGRDASEFIMKIYYFFKKWPLRRGDFKNVQNEVGVKNLNFIKHVETRWLSMEEAANRVIEQWDAIIKYFQYFVPNKRVALLQSNSYILIVNKLKKSRSRQKFCSLQLWHTYLQHLREPFNHLSL